MEVARFSSAAEERGSSEAPASRDSPQAVRARREGHARRARKVPYRGGWRDAPVPPPSDRPGARFPSFQRSAPAGKPATVHPDWQAERPPSQEVAQPINSKRFRVCGCSRPQYFLLFDPASVLSICRARVSCTLGVGVCGGHPLWTSFTLPSSRRTNRDRFF